MHTLRRNYSRKKLIIKLLKEFYGSSLAKGAKIGKYEVKVCCGLRETVKKAAGAWQILVIVFSAKNHVFLASGSVSFVANVSVLVVLLPPP
jgi:hypothetical protein